MFSKTASKTKDAREEAQKVQKALTSFLNEINEHDFNDISKKIGETIERAFFSPTEGKKFLTAVRAALKAKNIFLDSFI